MNGRPRKVRFCSPEDANFEVALTVEQSREPRQQFYGIEHSDYQSGLKHLVQEEFQSITSPFFYSPTLAESLAPKKFCVKTFSEDESSLMFEVCY
jgi:hypothetical protein